MKFIPFFVFGVAKLYFSSTDQIINDENNNDDMDGNLDYLG